MILVHVDELSPIEVGADADAGVEAVATGAMLKFGRLAKVTSDKVSGWKRARNFQDLSRATIAFLLSSLSYK